jgi:hypothetical protein
METTMMNNEPTELVPGTATLFNSSLDEEPIEVEPSVDSIIDSMIDDRPPSPIYIDDLPDAIVDGVFTLKEGGQLVIEKWLTIGSKPRWLGTSLYTIRHIDPFGSGVLILHDDELRQAAQANYITGPAIGWRFKVGSPTLNLHKRGKPEEIARLEKVAAQALEPIKESETSVPTSTEKTGRRGRPKGSKNRSREEIKAAKQELADLRAAKRAVREARRVK